MADLEHLEKMGRELKCPVCLSLFKSAVSLACNHIFCGSCISSSMKTTSSCPVCKVPFRRREVCPAPHMDNLVSIYKNMEIAAGVKIHTSQTAPLIKNSDGFHEEEPNSFMPQSKKTCIGKSKRKPVCKKKTKGMEKRNILECDSHLSMFPSIPTNKRVNVTPYSVSETPLRPEKVIRLGDTCIDCEINGESDVNVHNLYDEPTTLKEVGGLKETAGPVFSPFFWLREEDETNEVAGQASPQKTADDMSLPLVPCFSDIKDSDGGTPAKSTPTSKSHLAQVFDSEVFEWTQRACSPELSSTPIKQQIVDMHGGNGTRAQSATVSETQMEGNVTCSESVQIPSGNKVNQKAERCQVDYGKRKNIKRRKGLTCKKQGINIENSIKGMNGAHVDDVNVKDTSGNNSTPENAVPVNTNVEINATSSRKKRSNVGKLSACNSKRSHVKKLNTQLDATAEAEQYEQVQVPSQPLDSKIQNKCSIDKWSLFSMNSCENKEIDERSNAGIENIERSIKISSKSRHKCMRTSTDDAITEIFEEVPPDPCGDALKSNQNVEIPLPVSPCQRGEETQETEIAGRSKRNAKTRTCVQKTRVKVSNSKNRMTKYTDDAALLKDKENNEALSSRDDHVRKVMGCLDLEKRVTGKKEQRKLTSKNDGLAITREQKETPLVHVIYAERIDNIASNYQQKSGDMALENSAKPVETVDGLEHHCLKKCNRISSQIKCAFCKSSEETEVSGKMMHYFKCKPVASEYNGGSNIIHSHKHCTEWAPNVYFEDEVAINLTEELARSKRIKCSCCGITGAALGCFEKSCRKSFHFTCAKLVPECRWDTEKFVMLCPLHMISKLPCEVSPLEKQRKRKVKSRGCVKTNSNILSDANCSWNMNFQDNHATCSPFREPQGLAATKPEIRTSRQWKWPLDSPYKWVFCCSALNTSEKEIISDFTKLTGISVSKTWTPHVTHVIASIDDKGACRRTFKVLMGIIEGKWILKIDWLKACISKMEPVEEEQFEINIDNHGSSDGPRLGRLRAINKESKLLCGLEFHFMGHFTASYKGYLQELVIAAGGTVLQRKPIRKENTFGGMPESGTYIIYGRELPENVESVQDHGTFIHRQNEAKLVAENCGAKLAANTWLLDSIAACTLLNINEQKL